MSIYDMPEDMYDSYQCDCGGNVELYIHNGTWECDECAFERKNNINAEEPTS